MGAPILNKIEDTKIAAIVEGAETKKPKVEKIKIKIGAILWEIPGKYFKLISDEKKKDDFAPIRGKTDTLPGSCTKKSSVSQRFLILGTL